MSPSWHRSYPRNRALSIIVLLIVGVSNPSPASGQQLDSTVAAIEQQRIDAIESAVARTVCIFGPGGRGGGSGVVISADGFAVTNFHVIQSCGHYMQCGMADGKLYQAVIVGIDPVGDVALIKLIGREDFPVATLSDSDQVKMGDSCFAVGNPFLLATDFVPSVSWGVVSGTHRYQYPSGTLLEYTDCLQTDAAINPGNSGGPLFDANGNLIGINGRGSFEKRGRVNVGVGYAISSNQVQLFLSHLKSGRIVDHATTGFTVETSGDGRVRVNDILEDCQAYRAGVRFDDELIEFAGRRIDTVNQYKNILGIFPAGWRAPVVFRNSSGDEIKLQLRLRGVHAERELIDLITGRQASEEPGEPKPIKPLPTPAPLPANDGDPELHVARRGFANYHFNQLAQQRLWQRFCGQQNLQPAVDDAATSWRLAAKTKTQEALTLVLGDSTSGWQSTAATLVLDADVELEQQISDDSISGYLVGLHLWRKFLVQGPAKFGDSTYLGQIPWLPPESDTARPVEVIRSLFNSLTLYWMFDPASGKLVNLELYTDPEADPFEITLDLYQSDLDFPLPQRIRCRQAQLPEIEITVEKLEILEPAPEHNQQGMHSLPRQDSHFAERISRQPRPLATLEVALSQFLLGNGNPTRERGLHRSVFSLAYASGFQFFLDYASGFQKCATSKFAIALSGFTTGQHGSLLAGVLTAGGRLPWRQDSQLVAETLPKMVKIRGAGGFRGLETYQSGFFISADGVIATAWSYVLDADSILVTTNDGTRYDAKLLGYDPRLELALLKVDAIDVEFFDLSQPTKPRPGQRIFAFSNLYSIASGDEPVSVQRGRISGLTRLEARRGAIETSYDGQVALLDAITNNPGAAGGAVVDRQGKLIGIIGKEVRDASLGTWLNFCLPTDSLLDSVEQIRTGKLIVGEPETDRLPSEPITTELLGLVLVPDVVRQTPPYVDDVLAGSPADAAELLPDDLIISVNDRLVPGINSLLKRFKQIDRDAEVQLVIQRGKRFLTKTISVR